MSGLSTGRQVALRLLRRLKTFVHRADDDVDAQPQGPLTGRVPVIGVVAANALAGLLFGPVFGSALPSAVWVPVITVAAVLYVCYEIAHAWPVFEQWRPVVSTVLGLLAIVETTLHHTTASRLPTGASIRALYEGVRRSWLLTLQSTLPAHPSAQLVVFVPLLVLICGLVSVQVVTRTTVRLLSLLPALLVAGLAQAYYALSAGSAVLVVLAFALAAAAVLGRLPRLSVRVVTLVLVAIIPAVVLGSYVGAAFDPAKRSAYALQDQVASLPKQIVLDDPLQLLTGYLERKPQNLFTVRGNLGGTDRWPIVVYSKYNGVDWTASGSLRNVGARLDINRPTAVSEIRHSARVTIQGLDGPFIPSQTTLHSVSGVSPLVYPNTGTLLLQPTLPGMHYSLGYSTPDLGDNQLNSADLSPHQATSVNGLTIPLEIIDQARRLAGDAPPSFSTAVRLERFLATNYHLATGPHLPHGHNISQIDNFLSRSKVGTSEQFASAYVLLARIMGIPARLVVGFRQPATGSHGVYQITTHDVLAWPEVSVRGVGWIGLDPTSGARSQVAGQSPVDRALNQARQHVVPPPSKAPTTPQNQQQSQDRSKTMSPVDHGTAWWVIALLVVAGLLVLAGITFVSGIPIAKWLRNRARRRRRGNSAIVSAWLETRDRLRDHGVDIRSDMTVRDVRRVSSDWMSAPAEQALERLGDLVDSALWAGSGSVNRYPPDVAWGAYDTVRHSLSARPISERVVAGLTLRSLRPLP